MDVPNFLIKHKIRLSFFSIFGKNYLQKSFQSLCFLRTSSQMFSQQFAVLFWNVSSSEHSLSGCFRFVEDHADISENTISSFIN